MDLSILGEGNRIRQEKQRRVIPMLNPWLAPFYSMRMSEWSNRRLLLASPKAFILGGMLFLAWSARSSAQDSMIETSAVSEAANARTNLAVATPAPMPLQTAPILEAAHPILPAKQRDAVTIQIALDRHGFGSGLIDGRPGAKTRQALLDFRSSIGVSSDQDACQMLLAETDSAFVHYTITSNDWNQVGEAPTDWEEAALLPAMSCRTLLEWISEKTHASQNLLKQINPHVADFETASAGTTIWAPNVRPADQKLPIAQIAIDTHCFRLRGFDAHGHLVCSFPCSIARDRTKVPGGQLTVANVAPNPNYTFDPANFPESARAQEIGCKLILPPGPRNPVGIYWMSLSQPGYGIHGTPHPETIGNMESHGCFRLCNWDARAIGRVVTIGLPVYMDAPPHVLASH